MKKEQNLKQGVMLPGIRNARELGGYRIGDRIVRPGVLLRTAALNNASSETLIQMQKTYHLQTVIDFRMSVETEHLPDPVIPETVYLHLPVMELHEMRGADPELMARYSDPKTDRMQLFDAIYASGAVNSDLYQDFLLSPRGIEAYRAFFQALLELEPGRAVLWHCTDGKDRTGCAAMLVLSALGASRETVMEDYMLTNTYNKAMLDAVSEKVTPFHWPQEKRDILLFLTGGVIESFLTSAMDALTEKYGSIHQYLSCELGVGEEERLLLTEKYLI